MYHPSRGGVRGGQDQFDWEDVKVDKHRESYLGHSVMAPVGRWQKGKDLHWYTKSGKTDAAMSKQQEKDAIKKMEAEALAMALGKGNLKKQAAGVTKQELAEVCRKGQLERDSMDIERVEGMGFSSSRARLMDVASAPVRETLGASGIQEEGVPIPNSKSQVKPDINSFRGEGQSRDKTKKKKDKKEKKSKKEKKHKKKRHSDDDSSAKGEKRKRRHDHDEIDKSSKRETKRTHDQRGREKKDCEKDSKRKRHDSTSESESLDGKQRYSRHRDSSDEDISRTSSEKSRGRMDQRPKQRRHRHDTE